MLFLKTHKGIFFFLLVNLIIHSFISNIPPLQGDEAYFWEWSRHLAFGYYSHPPMTGWLVALFTVPLGVSPFTVRLASILLFLGTDFLVYLLTFELTGKKHVSLVAGYLYALLPVSFFLGIMMATDSALIFFFTLTVYFVRKAVIEHKTNHWYTAAISCSGMLLTKFMAFLFFPGIFLFLIFNHKYRKLFLTKEPYLSFALSILLFTPFLYWNMTHQWLTFQFNFVVRHQDNSFKWIKPGLYILGQMLAASPLIFILTFSSIVLSPILFRNREDKNSPDYKLLDSLRLLSYLVGFPLLFFLCISLIVEVGAHWLAIIYPLASVLVTVILYVKMGKFNFSHIQHKKLSVAILGNLLIILLPAIAVITNPKILPAKYIFSSSLDSTPPFASHYFGWEEVGLHIDRLKSEWLQKKKGFFFTSSDYAIASMLAFYTPSHPEIFLINFARDGIHGKDFLYWEKGKKRIGDNTIFISDSRSLWQEKMAPFFREIEQLEPLVIRNNENRILRIFYFTAGYDYLGGEPDNLSLW